MSEEATKRAQRAQHMADMVRDLVKKQFPEFALDGIEVAPTPKSGIPSKKYPTPDEVARNLVETLFPELAGDFTPHANHRRSIATIVAKKWASQLVEQFREGIEAGEQRNKRLRELVEEGLSLAQDARIEIEELQGDVRSAQELRGINADKAKDALQIKLDNAERAHATDKGLLETALRELAEARNELVAQQAKYDGLDRDHRQLMTAVSANAKAPKLADGWLAKAVEKCHEFWGENARRSPTAQMVLGDIIKARIQLQPLTLVGVKAEEAKTA